MYTAREGIYFCAIRLGSPCTRRLLPSSIDRGGCMQCVGRKAVLLRSRVGMCFIDTVRAV